MLLKILQLVSKLHLKFMLWKRGRMGLVIPNENSIQPYHFVGGSEWEIHNERVMVKTSKWLVEEFFVETLDPTNFYFIHHGRPKNKSLPLSFRLDWDSLWASSPRCVSSPEDYKRLCKEHVELVDQIARNKRGLI